MSISYPGPADNITYTYDQGVNGIGRLASTTDSTGTTFYGYDSFGRLVMVTRSQGGIDFVTSYGYSDNSEIESVTYPSGRIVTYHRNIIGNVESVTTTIDGETSTLAENIQYEPFGPVVEMTLGNGVVISNSYDFMYRLVNSVAGTFFDRIYGYYPDSAVQTISDNIDPAASQAYTYDTLGRLKTALGEYGNMAWNYDDVGNRLDQITDTGVTNYFYFQGTNLLTQVVDSESTDYTYDNVGNQMNINGNNLIWSQENRLLEVKDRNKSIAFYGYDDRGLRSVRMVGNDTVHSIYDLNGNILLESDDSAAVLNEYVYLNGMRLALLNQTVTTSKVKGETVTIVTDNTFYYVSDHLNTAQVVVDEGGSVVWQGNYTPFGEVDVVVNTIENNFRFPGQVFDPESGLYYNWHRFYDPETGRYVSADPIGLAGGMNLYSYVQGNPINWIDPWGLLGEVITFQPVGWGASSFGHTAYNDNGTVYSFGPNGMWQGSFEDYMKKNDFREAVGAVLNLTPQQGDKLRKCLDKEAGDYGKFTNNCGDPLENCLEELGFDLGANLFPVGLGEALDDGGYVKDYNFYPRNPDLPAPKPGSSAPWAR